MLPKLVLFALLVGREAWTTSATSPDVYFGGDNNDAYLAWVRSLDYPKTAFLPSTSDPDKGAALHWKIIDEEYIELGVAVKATGWLGFGLTINGGMTGADMLLVEAKDPNLVKDSYVQDERIPSEDDCQDWQMMNSTVDSTFLMIQVRRKLNTGDNQDIPIHNDADVGVPVSRVIAAWGDDEVVSYHGNNRARGSIRWFGEGGLEEEMFQDSMANQADGKFFIGSQDFLIPAEATKYEYFCFNTADLEAMGVNMVDGVTLIGFNPIIDKKKHLHHFVLQSSFQDIENSTVCSQETAMGEITYVWAPGEPPFTFPDNVGFKLGGEDGYRSFILEIHYDNVDLVQNQTDSSGVEVYYSLEPREYVAGYLVVGDSFIGLEGQEIERGLTDYKFDCPSECSALAISEPVTVLREYLHMHKSGYSSYNEQIRNETVVRRGSVEYYDFDQSGAPAVLQDPFQILPGDSFSMTCYYKNDEGGRVFGKGSSDEMCMAFLLYYPRKIIIKDDLQMPWMCSVGFEEMGLSECESAYTSRVLPDEEAPDRVFGTSSDTCNAVSSGFLNFKVTMTILLTAASQLALLL